MAATNNWYVYIVQCNDDTLYTGICCDVQRRIHEHNNLKSAARYTRVRRPVKLVYQEQASSRSTAAQREYRIKKMKTEEKQALIQQQVSVAHPQVAKCWLSRTESAHGVEKVIVAAKDHRIIDYNR